MVPAPLPEVPGAELPGEVDPDEPGGIVAGRFSLGLLGAELPVPYESLPLPVPDGVLPVPYEPVLLAPLAPIDPLPLP